MDGEGRKKACQEQSAGWPGGKLGNRKAGLPPQAASPRLGQLQTPAPPTPSLRPPGRHPGYFLGARSLVSLVCITESTAIYLHWANRAAVSGGTLTIFNDSGGGEALQDGGQGGKEPESRQNTPGEIPWGGDKRGL